MILVSYIPGDLGTEVGLKIDPGRARFERGIIIRVPHHM